MPDETQLHFGPYVLDRANARLVRGGAPVPITPKALDVLHYLASRPDRLVTKEDLLANVWADVLVSDASVKVCVREIREALQDDAKTPTFIETVHRRGYRFIAAVSDGALPGGAPGVQHRAVAAPAISAPPSGIVGRGDELGRLSEMLARAAGGQRQFVFIAGVPGTGKTTLVDSFVATVQAQQPEWMVLRGACFEQFGTGEPYLPVWAALASAPAARSQPAVSGLLALHAAAAASPERGQALATEPRTRSPRVLHDITETVEALASAAPVLLVIEDVHWADYSTLDFVSALARRRGPARLMVVATHRPPEFARDPQPLKSVVQELRAGHLAEVISLAPLDEASVAQYLAVRFPNNAFPAAFTKRLHHRTDGHPLFLTHVVDDLVEQGVLVRQGSGTWELSGADSDGGDAAWAAILDTQIPRTVRAIIETQLERLATEELQVLEAAAVAGVTFSAASAAAALEIDVVRAEEVCDAVARRHRFLDACGLSEWPDGTAATHFRFVHELYHNVVYERLPVARRARMHANLARRLEAAWGDRAREEAAELAMHAEQGRLWPAAVKYLRQAADAASRQYAHREAVDYLRRALAALDRLPPEERCADELPLLTSLAVNLQVTRGSAAPEVQQVLERARALCPADEAATRAQVDVVYPVLWAVWVFHKVRSDLNEAAAMASRMLSLAEAACDEALMLQAHQAISVTSLCLGRFDVTRRHMEQAERIYRPELHATNTLRFGQDPGIANLAFGAVALAILGEVERGKQVAQRAVAIARETAQPSTLALALNFKAMLHQIAGEPDACATCADETVRLASDEGFAFWHAAGRVLGGWSRAMRGDPAGGVEDIRRGLEAWLATGSRTYESYYLGLLAEALLKAGEVEKATRTVERALAMARELNEGLYEAGLHRIRGMCLARAGAPANEIAASFDEAIRVARKQGAQLCEHRAVASRNAVLHQAGPN